MTIDIAAMNESLRRLGGSPLAQFWRVAYAALSEPERVFVSVWELEAEVTNGGFQHYFSNTSGRIAPYVVDALRAIRAETMAKIAERALLTVDQDIPWMNDVERRRRLRALPPGAVEMLGRLDREFYAYPDDLTLLLYEYVAECRDEIAGAAAF